MPNLSATRRSDRTRRTLDLSSLLAADRQTENRRLAWIAAAALAWWALTFSWAGAAEPNWSKAPAMRQVPANRWGKLWADIESHMPAGHIYGDNEGPVNWGHETTHGIQSRLRRGSGTTNVFYVGGDRCIVLREPKMLLRHVAPFVPQSLRTPLYQDYVVKAATMQMGAGWDNWDDQPLYILDEWTAYSNGTEVALEVIALGGGDHGLEQSAQCMIQFCGFAASLLRAVDASDPNYADRDQLQAFVAWGVERALALADRTLRVIRSGQLTSRLEAFKREFFT